MEHFKLASMEYTTTLTVQFGCQLLDTEKDDERREWIIETSSRRHFFLMFGLPHAVSFFIQEKFVS